jgi:hypothetical protein
LTWLHSANVLVFWVDILQSSRSRGR